MDSILAHAKNAPSPHLANLTLPKVRTTFHRVSVRMLCTYLLLPTASPINTQSSVVQAVGVLTTATGLL